MRSAQGGFTLVELILVTVILGIISVVAVIRFGKTIDVAREGATKGNIGTLRSALALYYSDNQGYFPKSLDTQVSEWENFTAVGPFVGYYMEEIPPALLRRDLHSATREIGSSQVLIGDTVTDTGGWLYNSDTGKIYVNCYQTDSRGVVYSTY
jgi:general secretion pathway protein G